MSDVVNPWEETARRESCNRNYYRGLLEQIAEHLGPEVFIDDVGGVHDSPLIKKIPELVLALKNRAERNGT